jgi:hypothetical protein
MILAVIGIGAAGAMFFDVDFKYVIILSIVSLAVVVFIQIGVLAAAGLAIIGIAGYRFTSAQPLILLGLIGAGLLAIVLGSGVIFGPEAQSILEQGQTILGEFEIMPAEIMPAEMMP